MSLLPQVRDGEFAGDFARRKARYSAWCFVLALPASLWLFLRAAEVWPLVSSLEGTPFLLAAAFFGLLLAFLPLAAVFGFILAVWYGVESVYLPRRRLSPLADRIIVVLGLLVWFAPTAALLGASAYAIASGRIHFTRPPRDYYLATDPVAFWQGIGFWLIVAGAFGYLAWRYWRSKLARSLTR